MKQCYWCNRLFFFGKEVGDKLLCNKCYKKIKKKMFPDFKGDYGRCFECRQHPIIHKDLVDEHIIMHNRRGDLF